MGATGGMGASERSGGRKGSGEVDIIMGLLWREAYHSAQKATMPGKDIQLLI